jgi:hypothetical protein
MDFLKEILAEYQDYEDQEDLPPEDDELEDLPPEESDDTIDDLPPEDDEATDLSPEDDLEDLPDEEGMEGDKNDFESPNGDDREMDEIANKASEDPDKQGVIRKIQGAHLVYKREQEDGTYEEMWIYNSDKSNMKNELKIRRAIIADTDIPVGKRVSDDGKQSFDCWTAGNAEMFKLSGLVN